MADTTRRVEREARLQWVPVGLMKVNPLAQRELNTSRVNHLASHFDPEQMGAPTVNKREDHYFIIDGQHRIEAYKQWIGEDWKGQQIQCWTYLNLTEQEEAEKFLKLNDYLAVSAYSKFVTAVAAGRPDESDIDRIVRAHGLTVAKTKVPGAVGCVGTLQRVYRRAGSGALSRTLTIARDAYGDSGMEGPVLDGLGLLCQRYNGTLNDREATEALSNAHGGVNGLLGKARAAHKQGLGSLTHCVAAAAVEIINGRRKGGKKLPSWWKSS